MCFYGPAFGYPTILSIDMRARSEDNDPCLEVPCSESDAIENIQPKKAAVEH